MMLQLSRTTKFKSDIEIAAKRGKKIELLEDVIETLLLRKRLQPRYKDHKLTGNWVGRRECHIQPDWLLIYKVEKDTLILERTGSHSDLF
jgi:mRNA interferase YafQ